MNSARMVVTVDGEAIERVSDAQLREGVELSALVATRQPLSTWKGLRVTAQGGGNELRLHNFTSYGKAYHLALYWHPEKDAPAVGLFKSDSPKPTQVVVPVADVELFTSPLEPNPERQPLHLVFDGRKVVLTNAQLHEFPRSELGDRTGWMLHELVDRAGVVAASAVTKAIVVDAAGKELVLDGPLDDPKRTVFVRHRKDGTVGLVVEAEGQARKTAVQGVQSIRCSTK